MVSSTSNSRRFAALALGRWLLILMLTFDLIGSPLHAHAHDLGDYGFGTQVIHAGEVTSGPGGSRR